MLGEAGRPGTWQERVDPAWWIWKAHGGRGGRRWAKQESLTKQAPARGTPSKVGGSLH